ncbi:hypothetical protein L2E82_45665 [Cichorium intybus]|uniref:Uncharacterized protein n=1 Tax=Cichorium intybus TaxID=13427 RepID=A0ACB8ZTQ7_CICIN|nr:hypothetical protein L2E82_45665 [Cichorium intybus]
MLAMAMGRKKSNHSLPKPSLCLSRSTLRHLRPPPFNRPAPLHLLIHQCESAAPSCASAGISNFEGLFVYVYPKIRSNISPLLLSSIADPSRLTAHLRR